MNSTKTISLTLLAMIAFAGNSLLCRLALKQTRIDPASFTLIRIVSGAIALWIIRWALMATRHPTSGEKTPTHPARIHASAGNWLSALALFVYAAAFSFAYVQLAAGTGALLLFGAVQATMILWGFRQGERLDVIQVIGLILAVSGLVVLVFPRLSAPPLTGSILMLGAGVAWGIYSLRGKGERDPINATGGNFLRAVPFAILTSVAFIRWTHLDLAGISYAAISGAITSGLGYVIWYSVLPSLKATSAATVQLSVPILAASGGILLLGETITIRYLLASVVVLGGIALVILEKRVKR